MKKKVLIIPLFLLILSSLTAQNNLKIGGIFEKYGKAKGSTMVQLGTDVLSQGSRMTFYKSLECKSADAVFTSDIQAAISDDTRNKTIISESSKNGSVESGIYFLGKNAKDESEYILFKSKKDKTTIVYIRGKFAPQNLDYELNKLKDLFIYVNNKRVKL